MKDETVNFTREEHSYHQRRPIDASELIICNSLSKILLWANGRTPAWGEKLMCWWAMPQICTGQIQDCRLFHYLPVSHPVIWSVFLSISVSLCPSPPSLPLLLARWSLGREYERWKENKMPFDPAALCYSSVKEHYPDNLTKRKKKKISHRVSKPNIQTFIAETINAQAQSMDKLTKQEFGRIETTSLPSTFSFCFLSFFTFPTTSSTKSSEFSRQHFQLRLLWSNNCELHAMLHCWQLYCFMFDILTVWGEWYYPPVMQRTEENNAGTLWNWQEDEFTSLLWKTGLLFQTVRPLNFLSEPPSWTFLTVFGSKRCGPLRFKETWRFFVI